MGGPPTHQLPVLSEHATEVLIDAARIKAQEIGIGTQHAPYIDTEPTVT